MWLVELMLLSLVAGTILGVCWRLFDDWREKQEVKAMEEQTVPAHKAGDRLVNGGTWGGEPAEGFVKHGDGMPIAKVFSDKN
jgi:hypothetical protein